MVRSPYFDNNGMKKGAWSKDEDNKLRAFVLTYGHWNWRLLPKYAGLKRCGKSCRLRWVNHLKPGVRRGNFTKEEEDIIIKLHAQLGNKWSAIAAELPGRTDNDIKNFWHTRITRKRKPNPSASEASSMDHQFEMARDQSAMARDQSADSLIQFQQSTPAFDANSSVIPVSAQPQIESCFPPLIEDEFCYPGLNYSELSSSNESLMEMDALDWIRDQGSMWDDSFALSSLEGNGGIFDPVFCLWN